MDSIKNSLQKVLDSIKETELKVGRKAGEVSLVAVSKFHPVESVLEAISCGQMLFGENRVQEATEKFEIIKNKHSEAKLHIIGSLQRNKVKNAIKYASCIQSVDRIELMTEIIKCATNLQKKIQVMFEIHTGEVSKAGFSNIDDLLRTIELSFTSDFVEPIGFMTMAPFTNDELVIAKSFRKVVNIQNQVGVRFPKNNLTELSMGMSNDYKIAIAEGATMVRIGTAIFGERLYK